MRVTIVRLNPEKCEPAERENLYVVTEDRGDRVQVRMVEPKLGIPPFSVESVTDLVEVDFTDALAVVFARVLHDWLGVEKMQEVVRRNDAETDQNICHSHDFCDANEAMADAWIMLDNDMDKDASDDWGRTNAAWDHAKNRKFAVTLP